MLQLIARKQMHVVLQNTENPELTWIGKRRTLCAYAGLTQPAETESEKVVAESSKHTYSNGGTSNTAGAKLNSQASRASGVASS